MEAATRKRSEQIRYGWMRVTYGATAFLGIVTGTIMLLGPDEFGRRWVGIPYMLPEQDPVIYGALASIWLTVGILCAFGVRTPLKFLPLLGLQFIYKTFWFACIFFPLMWRGEFPEWGWASAVGNLIWMILDTICVPWWYLFSPHMDPDAPTDAARTSSETTGGITPEVA